MRNGYITITKITLQSKENYRREGYYIMIKESIHQEDIAIINMYAPNKVLYNM